MRHDNGLIKNPAAGERGFTLVELLIVVAIIAVLAAIAIPQFGKYKLRGYKSELDSDAKNIYTAAQNYLTDYSVETISALDKAESGGYRKSPDISFLDGSMTLSAGNIEIYSTTLKLLNRDNNAVIFFDGKIEFSNSP